MKIHNSLLTISPNYVGKLQKNPFQTIPISIFNSNFDTVAYSHTRIIRLFTQSKIEPRVFIRKKELARRRSVDVLQSNSIRMCSCDYRLSMHKHTVHSNRQSSLSHIRQVNVFEFRIGTKRNGICRNRLSEEKLEQMTK